MPYSEDFSVEMTVAQPVLLHVETHVLKSALVSPGEAIHRTGSTNRSRADTVAMEPGSPVIGTATPPCSATGSRSLSQVKNKVRRVHVA